MKRHVLVAAILFGFGIAIYGCSAGSNANAAVTPVYTYRVVNIYPHDRNAFTQGLVYYNGELYESTGLQGQSSLRRVELQTGRVLQIHRLASQYFAEGLVLWQDRLIQLTWTSRVGFVYDRATFQKLSEFSYASEGWGITHNGKHLIMSDGSDLLRFLDPVTFQIVSQLPVRDGSKSVPLLNELEYVEGEIYANVWQTDRVARIAPTTGKLVGWIDLAGLLSAEERQQVDVLNGIAYDAQGKRLFVTGKLWPKLFQIEVVKKQ